MAFDEETLKDFREIMSENFSDKADVFRKIVTPLNAVVSDGMGGLIYNQDSIDGNLDERTKVLSQVPCRVTVPRANRSDAEYVKNDVFVQESRVVIVFPFDTDIRQGDRIDVLLRNVVRSYEVQVIADHSESYSLQVNCVELKVQKI